MIMENPELILEELERFEKKTGDGMSKMLEDYIHHIAKTGDTIFPWHRIRHFMQHMLETVMNEFYETCGNAEDVSENSNVPPFSFFTTRDKLLHHFDTFTGAPFTIQRLCEIMVDPTRHYRRTDKFMRGLEKNVLVVSSIEPGSRQRRTEDPQHTLVNGLQEGGLHTSPLAASPIPSLPHHPKRVSHTQSTNSVLNNSNDSYNAEMNDSENQVTISEANGPSGLHREDQAADDSPSDPSEPPSKKMRLEEEEEEEEDEEEEPFEERGGEPPAKDLTEAKSVACSEQETKVEAMEVEEGAGKEVEAEAKMETEEAEVAGTTVKESDGNPPPPQNDEEEPQEASSNPVTVTETSEDAKEPENHLKGEAEEEGEEMAAQEEVLPSEASPEVCSSNSHTDTSPPKGEEAEVFSSSSSSRACEEGSPDSGEGPEEGTGGQEVPDVVKERESSSEAAAADEENRSESPSAGDGSLEADESSRNSHEADSTSQTHSSGVLSHEADTAAPAEAEVDSAVPSPPPAAEVDHSNAVTAAAAAAAAVAVESPTPSNSSSVYPTSDVVATPAAHTTSESPAPSTSATTTTASITTTTTTTTTTTNHSRNGVSASPDSESPEPTPEPASASDPTPSTDTDSATAATSSTSSQPQSASSRGSEQEGAAAQSCHKRTLASISCSSSRQSEPDHQPTEEE